jgi:hypothetical protein
MSAVISLLVALTVLLADHALRSWEPVDRACTAMAICPNRPLPTSPN